MPPNVEPCLECGYDGDGECHCETRFREDKERAAELAEAAGEAHVNPQLLLGYGGEDR